MCKFVWVDAHIDPKRYSVQYALGTMKGIVPYRKIAYIRKNHRDFGRRQAPALRVNGVILNSAVCKHYQCIVLHNHIKTNASLNRLAFIFTYLYRSNAYISCRCRTDTDRFCRLPFCQPLPAAF